jgi:hypothetical protein
VKVDGPPFLPGVGWKNSLANRQLDSLDWLTEISVQETVVAGLSLAEISILEACSEELNIQAKYCVEQTGGLSMDESEQQQKQEVTGPLPKPKYMFLRRLVWFFVGFLEGLF